MFLLGLLAAAGVLPVPTPSKPPPGSSMLDDRPEPLVPKVKRSEAEQDRLDALTLFSTARVAEDHDDLARACGSTNGRSEWTRGRGPSRGRR